MSITVHMPNEKVAKAFLAAKPDNVDAKGVTVKVAEPSTQDLKLVNNSSNPKKGRRLGVMSITKAENAQLGLLLKEIYTQFKEHNDGSDIYIPCDVLQYPEAFEKLCGRYS